MNDCRPRSRLGMTLEGTRHTLAEEHQGTRDWINNLIELYEAWGKPEKAEEWRAKLPGKEDKEKQ